MKVKNVKISEEHHKKMRELCHIHGLKQKDFVESCINLFYESKESPKSNYTNEALRDTFIRFIRKQESLFLKPIQNDVSMINKELKDIQSNIEFIFNKMK